MKNETMIAVNKLVSNRSKDYKEARAQLEPGEYDIDTTVRVKGKIKVSPDTLGTPTSSLLNQDFLALVLHHAGITRDSAVKILDKVASDYLSGWTGSDEDKKKAKEARKEAVSKFDPDGKIKEVFDNFKASLPVIPSKGKIKWKGSVEEIGLSEVAELDSATVEEVKLSEAKVA
jgi:hypothetical protein